uniref:Integrase zinc-binding domain-containing protein n=1 Tax=Anopheles stephensi TaxID=30069 RepID=A0A182YPS8_ANOST
MSRKGEVVKGPLTAKEIRSATLVIVRLVQRETFQPEILALMDGANRNHRLNGLKAFLDPDYGIVRVGGRIKRAFIPYDSRHQMLLPTKHPITEAIIRQMHLDNLHIGQRGLLAIVRQRYWPLNAKKDGVTRVVTVKMANGAEFKRAVTEVFATVR